MNEEKLKWAFAIMVVQGLDPQPLDEENIVEFENAVQCGDFTGIGDRMVNWDTLKRVLTQTDGYFTIFARGDSMLGLGIEEGDKLKVSAEDRWYEGDTIVVINQGEATIKTYYEDEDGMPWLIPHNEDYDAIPIKDRNDLFVLGKVVEVRKSMASTPSRYSAKMVNKKKRQMEQAQPIDEDTVKFAINSVAPMIKNSRQWYAVFRALVDEMVINKGDYRVFCSMVKDAVGEHECMPTVAELQRMAVDSFAKPVCLWNEDWAPVKGKRYDDYLTIAEKTKTLLR